MDPEPDAGRDDQAQRVADCGADGASERHRRGNPGECRQNRPDVSAWRFRISSARSAVCLSSPGVYLFLGAGGETLYVGKARVLRDRVRSYLGAQGTSPRLDALLRDAAALDVIVTDSVVEALALENRLIKQRNPRFNVLLRDDKTYPYLQLTTTEPAPRLLVARQVARDGNVYAGPFMPAVGRAPDDEPGAPAVRDSIVQRSHRRPARSAVPRIRHQAVPGAVRGERLLARGVRRRGRTGAAADRGAAGRARRSAAGRRCSRRPSARNTSARRTCATRRRPSRRWARGATRWRRRRWATATRSASRSGRPAPSSRCSRCGAAAWPIASNSSPSAIRSGSRPACPDERALVAIGVQQFYADRQPPPEVHTPVELPGRGTRRDGGVAVGRAPAGACGCVTPKRGDRRGLLDLAARNAAIAYQTHFADGGDRRFDALETLRATLALPALPRRIECFDISTFQGARDRGRDGGDGGRPARASADYRKYKIEGPDRRMILPRCTKWCSAGTSRALDQGGPFPDLIVIDGGKGQLSAAYAALREVGLDRLVAIGLAKEEELIFTRDRAEGLALPRESPALRLLQRDSRRGAPVCGDVPSATRARSATSRPCWTRSTVSGRAAGSSCSRRSGRWRASGGPAATIWPASSAERPRTR